jgi:hypothetical protein
MTKLVRFEKTRGWGTRRVGNRFIVKIIGIHMLWSFPRAGQQVISVLFPDPFMAPGPSDVKLARNRRTSQEPLAFVGRGWESANPVVTVLLATRFGAPNSGTAGG